MIVKGQKISDRYQIIKSIGEGGMANVYLAYDTILDRNVAVKILRGDLASDEKFVRRFQREALAASSLYNQNIVEVYDVGEDNGMYYIVMEYIDGKHLKTLLKKRGKLTVSEAIDIMMQIASGLSVAHDQYLIHRDIKPQNIMILENGLVKITDFGIAMAMNSTQLTQTNSVMGSVHYLPPEQASGKGASLQSDIYSMGILMYELLTGKLPYHGDNAVEIALKHLKEPLPSIREQLPSIPQSVENIIIKATAKNPKNRYADAKEMYEDLKTCLDEERLNEEKYTFKYPENDYDETKMLKVIKEKEKESANEDAKKNGKKIKKVKEKKKDDSSESKKQNKLLIVLASIFTGLVIIITSIVILIPIVTSKSQIEIPDVTNKTLKEATKIIQDKGFQISEEQVEQASETIPEGNVIRTNPVAGTRRKKGYEVVLYVSLGDAKITVDNYTGKNFSEVKGALEAQKIHVLKEEQELEGGDVADENEIIGQSVEVGQKLSAGDTITLYVADTSKKYPNFVTGDWTEAKVKAFADENGLEVEVNKVADSTKDDGTIVSQNPQEGYTIREGQKFRISVVENPVDQPDNPDDDTTWY
ncbi:MAG: Stk1 family PASTA domain-containing Ser/Thr kinase [Bacilli bacterium]|nr:Stk1 family PASTA domain-containing Ser/Thr kinase [Bacilli bacterium]